MAALTTLVVSAALPASASAWSATVSGSTLLISASPGEANDLELSGGGVSGYTVTDLHDLAFASPAPPSCSTPSPASVRCPSAAIAGVRIDAGDGADRIEDLSSVAHTELLGGEGNDALAGGSGPDVLAGGGGSDLLEGGSGADVLSGGDGQDSISGGAEADSLDGGAGGDSLEGGSGADSLSGGEGDDVLGAGSEADSLDGGAGDDALDADTGPDVLTGGPGADRLDGGDGEDTLSGEEGDDRLNGGEGSDSLNGGTENDELHGEGGEDTLVAGDGTDVLNGDEGSDSLAGGSGVDELNGGDEPDRLDGGSANDFLAGGPGADVIAGGAGFDRASYADAADPVMVSLNGKADDGLAGERDDVRPDIESLKGGSGDDTLTGDAGDNTLDGGPGTDHLNGAGGADRVLARDQQLDLIACGPRRDIAQVDGHDKVGRDCESVFMNGRRVEAPRLLLVAAHLRGGSSAIAVLALRCGRANAGRCRGKIALSAGSGGRSYRFGKRHFSIAAGKRATLFARVPAALARSLRRHGAVHGQAEISVGDGLRRRVKLREGFGLRAGPSGESTSGAHRGGR